MVGKIDENKKMVLKKDTQTESSRHGHEPVYFTNIEFIVTAISDPLSTVAKENSCNVPNAPCFVCLS